MRHQYIYVGTVCGKNRRVGVRGGKVYSTSEYRSFIDLLAFVMRAKNNRMRWGTFEGPVAVRITEKINPKRDIDSLVAPILDAMQKAWVIRNDSQVKKVFLHKINDTLENVLTISVEEISGEKAAS